jgi:glycosyltransferase involved in cell wall biosynthesis
MSANNGIATPAARASAREALGTLSSRPNDVGLNRDSSGSLLDREVSINEDSPMRIGLVAPPWFAVPPAGYGGIERVVSYLADGLARRGHFVTLFAAGGSQTEARLVSAFHQPPSGMLGDLTVEIVHTASAYASVRDFDLIHDHTLAGLASAVLSPVPVVHTMHGPITPSFARLYETVSPPVNLVAISRHQQSTLPPGLQSEVIYNGICLDKVPFSSVHGTYLLFVGRMSPEKGILDAIEIARRAERPLLVVAKVNESAERDYFDDQVAPALRSMPADVLFEPPEARKQSAYRDALATLFPIRWPEPFGLVMLESMATGTPVVAFCDGAVPEVLVDGETGFICSDAAEAAEAVNAVPRLDRTCLREHVASRFDTDTAIMRHEELFRRVLHQEVPVAGAAKVIVPRR